MDPKLTVKFDKYEHDKIIKNDDNDETNVSASCRGMCVKVWHSSIVMDIASWWRWVEIS